LEGVKDLDVPPTENVRIVVKVVDRLELRLSFHDAYLPLAILLLRELLETGRFVVVFQPSNNGIWMQWFIGVSTLGAAEYTPRIMRIS
jgi:hypothetical protein